MKKIFFLVGVAALIASCATLTPSQLKSVNQFAETSKNFSAYPSKILDELSAIRLERTRYFAASLRDPRNIIPVLDSMHSTSLRDFSVNKKVDITFRIIDKYAQSLLLLSSEKFSNDLREQSKRFGTDIDSLITQYNGISGTSPLPTGIGGAINKLVVFAGRQYIRSVQAREVKKFVPRADTLIGVMTDNLIQFLQNTSIAALIKAEETGLAIDFLQYFGHQNHQPASLEDVEKYLSLKRRLTGTRELQAQTLQATRKLRAAHTKLLTTIETRQTLKEIAGELRTFTEEVKDIHKTISGIENAKKPKQ